jgi:hypothetical protein
MTRKAELVPEAPEPSAAEPKDGMAAGRALARRYLLESVRLLAAIAFGEDSEASLFVRVNCVRQLSEIAGAIPQSVPGAPQAGGDGSAEA